MLSNVTTDTQDWFQAREINAEDVLAVLCDAYGTLSSGRYVFTDHRHCTVGHLHSASGGHGIPQDSPDPLYQAVLANVLQVVSGADTWVDPKSNVRVGQVSALTQDVARELFGEPGVRWHDDRMRLAGLEMVRRTIVALDARPRHGVVAGQA